MVASTVVMAALYVGKMRIATRMQSRSLRAEAMESLFCDLQDLSILVGLGLNSLFSWWWADPVSALFLVPFFVKEGWENIAAHHDEHDDRETRVCFCSGCSTACAAAGRPVATPDPWVYLSLSHGELSDILGRCSLKQHILG